MMMKNEQLTVVSEMKVTSQTDEQNYVRGRRDAAAGLKPNNPWNNEFYSRGYADGVDRKRKKHDVPLDEVLKALRNQTRGEIPCG